MSITIGDSELDDLAVIVGGLRLLLVLERKAGRLHWALGSDRLPWWWGVAPMV